MHYNIALQHCFQLENNNCTFSSTHSQLHFSVANASYSNMWAREHWTCFHFIKYNWLKSDFTHISNKRYCNSRLCTLDSRSVCDQFVFVISGIIKWFLGHSLSLAHSQYFLTLIVRQTYCILAYFAFTFFTAKLQKSIKMIINLNRSRAHTICIRDEMQFYCFVSDIHILFNFATKFRIETNWRATKRECQSICPNF